MSGRIDRARTRYEQAVFNDDTAALAAAERDLDAVEADVALARGRIVHVRFLAERGKVGSAPAEDPSELPLFRRALELYRGLGDSRGEAEALFWVGCVYQVIRRDDRTAVPDLERSRELAAQVGDKRTEAEALRHLGIAAHTDGRLDEARRLLEQSSRLRQEVGLPAGVAANMVGLAYIAAAQQHRDEAFAILQDAHRIAEADGAAVILRQIEEARAAL